MKIKINISFVKDAQRNYAPDACPETSVRVCFFCFFLFCLGGGVNSRFTFQELESIVAFCVLV